MVGLMLLEAQAAGLTVLAGDGGRLVVRGPASAEKLALKLLENKADVLEYITIFGQVTPWSAAPTPANAADPETETPIRPPPTPVCRCGSSHWRDVSIHGGQSTRRDCDRCGRFIDFVRWYAKNRSTTQQQQTDRTGGQQTRTRWAGMTNGLSVVPMR